MQPILKYSPDLLQSLGRIGVDGVIRALPLCSAPSIPSTARAPAPEVEFCSVSQACWRRFSPSDSSPSRTLPASTSSFSLPRSFLLSNSLATATTTNHAIGSSVFVRSYAKLHKNIYRPTFKLPPEVKEVADATFKEYKSKKLPEPRAPPLVHRELKNASRRVGCIAVKAGMTQEWDEYGARVPLTVLFIDDCQVVGLKTPERNGYRALQVGSGYAKQKSLDGAKAGFYISQGVPFKEHLVEFQVSSDAVLPVGTHITAAHYVPGQHVDIAGWTKDKGFQGVMKRWGFAGLPASHGVSLHHRAPGAIGCRTDPGRVWKGKKLPSLMGERRRTVHNCLVYKVDPQRHVVYIRGQVPGPAGSMVYLRDAFNVKPDTRKKWEMPFPTFLGDPSATPPSVYRNPKDPYRMFSEETDYFPIDWKKGD